MKRAYVIIETERTDKNEYIPCIVQEGTTGYYPTDWSCGVDKQVAEHHVKDMNNKLGITNSQAEVLLMRSMLPNMSIAKYNEMMSK